MILWGVLMSRFSALSNWIFICWFRCSDLRELLFIHSSSTICSWLCCRGCSHAASSLLQCCWLLLILCFSPFPPRIMKFLGIIFLRKGCCFTRNRVWSILSATKHCISFLGWTTNISRALLSISHPSLEAGDLQILYWVGLLSVLETQHQPKGNLLSAFREKQVQGPRYHLWSCNCCLWWFQGPCKEVSQHWWTCLDQYCRHWLQIPNRTASPPHHYRSRCLQFLCPCGWGLMLAWPGTQWRFTRIFWGKVQCQEVFWNHCVFSSSGRRWSGRVRWLCLGGFWSGRPVGDGLCAWLGWAFGDTWFHFWENVFELLTLFYANRSVLRLLIHLHLHNCTCEFVGGFVYSAAEALPEQILSIGLEAPDEDGGLMGNLQEIVVGRVVIFFGGVEGGSSQFVVAVGEGVRSHGII